jgi:uncharacterized protein YggE
VKGGRQKNKMDNSVKITGMIILAILVVSVLGIYFFNQVSGGETIRSDGVSSVSVVPDMISVYFNVETNGTSAKEAKDMNSEITNKVVDSLLSEGFEREDIETLYFNVYENFDWTAKGRVSKGYKATHSIRVKFSTKESDKIGSVIDAGIDAGAMLSYINFELSQSLENQYKAEVLKLATEDARIKAEAMVEGLGMKLGRVVSVSNSDFGYTPWIAYDMRGTESSVAVKGSEVATDIQPGEQEITGRVSVVYKFN